MTAPFPNAVEDSSSSSVTVAAPVDNEMPPPNENENEDDVPGWNEDPANAKNWSLAKRIYNTLVPALLCVLMLATPLKKS
jgi:hypothetical protein